MADRDFKDVFDGIEDLSKLFDNLDLDKPAENVIPTIVYQIAPVVYLISFLVSPIKFLNLCNGIYFLLEAGKQLLETM